MYHSPIAAMPDPVPCNQLTRLSPPWAWPCLLILLSVLFVWPTTASAQAQCYYDDGRGNAIDAPATQIVTFNSVTIALTSQSAGTPIGPQRAATTTGGLIYITCLNRGTPGGLQPSYGTYDAANKTIYSPTPGVAFKILRSGTPIPLYPNDSLDGGRTTFSNTTTFQLISTGVLPSSGNQIPAGTILGQWNFDNVCTKPIVNWYGSYNGCTTNASVRTVIIFQSGGVTFTAPTCTVSTGSKTLAVTLPPVATSAFGAVGATAGTTPFAISLTKCKSHLDVSATLSTSNPYGNVDGVIAPNGAGYAAGVGIQVLQPDGTTPVKFDTAFSTGTTNGPDYTFNLYARYYQTATSVSPGEVQGTATYTLTYQ